MAERLESIRELYRAFDRGDLSDEALGFMAEDIEWRWPAGVPGPDVLYGREQVAAALRRYREAWDEFSLTAEEFIPVGEEGLLVPNHHKGRGKGSGIELDRRFCDHWTFRGDRAIAFQGYLSKEEALAAVGAPEQDRP
jgi:ketosteroid isomerase-like protein